MKSVQTDQLRDALRREMQHIEPVGLGLETVQRRGRGRRNRGRAAGALATATCVAAVGFAVTHHDSGAQHQLAVGAQTGAAGDAAPTLEFRTVAGTVSYSTSHFTTPGGVTYSLSTAPGVADGMKQPDQAIYASSDGEHFTTANQHKSWIADLTERDGVLYAIGTAPGATANDTTYQLATSHDGGQGWNESNLPFDVTAPNATVPMTHSDVVQVARGSSTTVALMTSNYWPNLDALVAERTPGHANVSTRQTAAGFDLVDLSACVSAKVQAERGIAADPTATTLGSRAAVEAKCATPPVLGTITWGDIGLSGASDLRRQQMLVSSDGTHWNTASAPASEFVRDLVATNDGFLLLSENTTDPANGGRPTNNSTLLRSTDATHWTPVSTPPGVTIQAIAGDRVIGIDAAGAVQTSTDGGTTWTATAMAPLLPAGAPAVAPDATTADAGPLGFAVVANADSNPNDGSRGADYLLFSTDGVNWSTTALASVGEPAGVYPQVTVGADHVSLGYDATSKTSNGTLVSTTLLGTPKR